MMDLHWYTELPAAVAEAQRTDRPILSLRLLGRLDEALSCANSRFFRKLLYPDARVRELLEDAFVLHWQSVRPVPRVTIDFGDGRVVERTLTGNSVHLILDRQGRPADALPGLFAPHVFRELLARGRILGLADRSELPRLHREALERPPLGVPRASRAFEASRIAPTKHRVEMPLLRAVSPDVDGDTRENLALHARVHEAFSIEWSVAALVEWIYRELFLMPIDDPALGLDVEDPFSPSDTLRLVSM